MSLDSQPQNSAPSMPAAFTRRIWSAADMPANTLSILTDNLTNNPSLVDLSCLLTVLFKQTKVPSIFVQGYMGWSLMVHRWDKTTPLHHRQQAFKLCPERLLPST